MDNKNINNSFTLNNKMIRSQRRHDQTQPLADITTPEFNATRRFAQGEFTKCEKCAHVLNQYKKTNQKLLVLKQHHEKLLQKKQEELLSAYQLLEESEKRTKSYVEIHTKSQLQLTNLKEKLQKLKLQCQELTEFKQENEGVLVFLKQREIALLNRIKNLEEELINKNSILDHQRIKYKDYLEGQSSIQLDLIDEQPSNTYDDVRFELNYSPVKINEERAIQNPQIPKILQRMQNKMTMLMDEQKVLQLKNDVLQMRINEARNTKNSHK